MAFTKLLVSDLELAPGAERRFDPGLAVSEYERLHFHVGGRGTAITGLKVAVLFGTPVDGGWLIADNTIWYSENTLKRDFQYVEKGNDSGFVMSVPVVAPSLYALILSNTGSVPLRHVFVSLLAQ
jgi:hypothetical protein